MEPNGWATASSTTPRGLHAASRVCTMSHIGNKCVMPLALELRWCRHIKDTAARCLLATRKNIE